MNGDIKVEPNFGHIENIEVVYFPVWNILKNGRKTRRRKSESVHSVPFLDNNGVPVVFLDGVLGYVSLWHVIPRNLAESWLEEKHLDKKFNHLW